MQGSEAEVLLRVFVADAPDNFAQGIPVGGIAALRHPFSQQAAENAPEVGMAGVGEEAAGVGEHAHKAGQHAQIGQRSELLGHALEMVVEPPGRAVLQLADRFRVLEAADDGADGGIVIGIQAVKDGFGELAADFQGIQKVRQLRRVGLGADAVIARIGTQVGKLPAVVVALAAEVQLHDQPRAAYSRPTKSMKAVVKMRCSSALGS